MNFSNPVNNGVTAFSVIPGFIFFVVGVVLVAAVIIFVISLINRDRSGPINHRQRPLNDLPDATDAGLAASILYTVASVAEAKEPSFTPPADTEIAGGGGTHHHSSGYEHEHGHSHGYSDSGSGGSFDSGSSSSDSGSSGGGSDGGGGGGGSSSD